MRGIMKGRFHRIACHLALAALLLKAFVPPVAAALEQRHGLSGIAWADLCTPGGLLAAGAGSAVESAPADDTSNAAHCPYCLLQSTPAILASAGARDWSSFSRDIRRLPRVLRAPRTALLWAATRARAPPTLS